MGGEGKEKKGRAAEKGEGMNKMVVVCRSKGKEGKVPSTRRGGGEGEKKNLGKGRDQKQQRMR